MIPSLTPQDAARAAFGWLTDAAWPLWLAHGVDWERRGFRDNLDCETLASPAGYRRLRVAARQIFVFSRAARHGTRQAAEAVELGVEFLLERALQSDNGYASRFGLDNAVIDTGRDLYDHAFVLLALATASDVLQPGRLRQAALELVLYLETHFIHPAGGFVESLPVALPRRQNPHMHLLEACLAAFAAFGDDIFRAHAQAIIRLFLQRFFDPACGGLVEYFDDALNPITESGRYVVEPGHHYQWVWLLDWFAALCPGGLGAAASAAGRGLTPIIDKYGINPATGTAYDEIWNDGALKEGGSRLWPQTERLKSAVLRPDATPAEQLAAFAGLERYLLAAPRGLWTERLEQDGAPVTEPAPASSLYHLTEGIMLAHRELGA